MHVKSGINPSGSSVRSIDICISFDNQCRAAVSGSSGSMMYAPDSGSTISVDSTAASFMSHMEAVAVPEKSGSRISDVSPISSATFLENAESSIVEANDHGVATKELNRTIPAIPI